MSNDLEFGEELERPRTGIDRLKADDELYQSPPEAGPADYVWDPHDGMPKPNAPPEMPFAPPLAVDRLVCMADTSEFVVRDRWGEVLARFRPDEVEQTPDGRYRVPVVLYLLRRAGLSGPAPVGRVPGYKQVEPVRPQCRHFHRQLTDITDDSKRMFVARLCSARRDDGGEFLSVRDAQMWACDLREPFEPRGPDRINRFDAMKVELGAERTDDIATFDVDAAIDDMISAENAEDPTGGGILK